ncbi:hypothetical protein ACFDR9_001651 [Janthinobacterium sp. CG_23.3]|nr:hypothetical protein [Janthinobacterium sp. CG_S6]
MGVEWAAEGRLSHGSGAGVKAGIAGLPLWKKRA